VSETALRTYLDHALQELGIKDGGGPNTLKALVDNVVDVADIYTTTPSIKIGWQAMRKGRGARSS